VAEWIYPIPKNLRNAEFLRNLTKERVFYSIVHGIKGTPMPPWGEAPEKPTSDGIPVLSHEEIRSLVDWLYSSLPGGGIIKSDDDVPKWKYSPQDALRELYREGNTLPASEKPLPYLEIDRKHHKEESPLSALPKGEGYYAMRPSLNKKTAFDFIPRTLALIIPTSTHREMAVDEVFETVPNSFPSEPEKNAYFIKKHYYTPANIEQGKLFFQTNCAVCHGNEADGTGVRAGVMQDAKPRMLTNLDWLATRDDLRLLRSIKFGVPGTSMTPWGDLTTSLQRLQLVIFIRSLTDFPKKREELLSQLYQAFDRSKFMIEEARSAQFSLIDKWQQELNQIKIEESSLAEKVESAEKVSPKALELYQKRLLVTYKLEQQKEVDQILVDLENEIDKEKALYKNLGEEILSKMMDEASLQTFLKMLALYENTYSMNQGRLVFEFKPEKESALRAFKDSLINQIEKQVVQLEKEKQILQGKIGSHLGEELVTLTNELQAFVALKKKILTGYEEALRSITKQKTLLELFHNQLKDNKLQP
jgi:mono/diheme cytochrome c family protein